MKKLSIGLTLCLLLGLFICPGVSAESDFRLIVDGNSHYVDTLTLDNRLHIPVSQTAKALGMNISWNAKDQIITLTKDNDVMIIQVGNKNLTFNSNVIEMDATPKIIDGRVMLPCSWIIRPMGYSNQEQDNGNALIISTQTTTQERKIEFKQEALEYFDLEISVLKMLINPSKLTVQSYIVPVGNFTNKINLGAGGEYIYAEQLMKEMCNNMLSAFAALLGNKEIVYNLQDAKPHMDKLSANFKLFSAELDRLKAEGLY